MKVGDNMTKQYCLGCRFTGHHIWYCSNVNSKFHNKKVNDWRKRDCELYEDEYEYTKKLIEASKIKTF